MSVVLWLYNEVAFSSRRNLLATLSPGGRGVPLGILGGGVTPGSPNPDRISDQKMQFSTPVFRPDL